VTPAAALGTPPVRAVLFDYGMTLVTFERPGQALREAYTAIATHLGKAAAHLASDPESLVAAVHDRVEAVVAAHDAAGPLTEIDLAPVYRQAYRDVGIELGSGDLDQVQRLEQRAWFAGVRLGDGVAGTLTELRRRGIRTGLCSNAPYHAATLREQLAHLGLDRLLDSATFSADAGWRKPSERIFLRALADLGAEAATTVMVGDRVDEDIAGARAAGLRSVLLRQHRHENDPAGLADAVVERIQELPDLV
jgi:HAD superfamily hydrolase (TIGR01509 family)